MIKVTPLSYRIQVSPNGQLLGTNILLQSYLKRFAHNIWDKRQCRYLLYRRYVRYDEKTSTLYAPRYDLEDFCQLLVRNNVLHSIERLPLQRGAEVSIVLKSHIKDRNTDQTEAITHLITCSDSLRGLSLAPGFGKTYCSIKFISLSGLRSMIFVGGLIDQWKRSIFDFTELTEDDVYVVQGAASMTKLLLKIDKTIFPKIILCSLGTIRAYASGGDAYENYPPFNKIFDILRVGIKIIDEAHLNFFLTMMIDLQTNAEVNVALTATFDRGEQDVKKIFNFHYPRLMRFGEENFKRYVDIYSYRYTLGGVIPAKAYTTIQGYNNSKLEEWLLRKGRRHLDNIYSTVYSPAIHSHYINCKRPGQRLLILCSSIVMCQWFREKLISDLSGDEKLEIELYIGETDDIVLTEADIIISTPGSGGTGRDIKELRTVLMTVATGSDTMNRQSLGRLRELPSGDTPNYIYTWNIDIEPHLKYHDIRKITYQNRGKSFSEIKI